MKKCCVSKPSHVETTYLGCGLPIGSENQVRSGRYAHSVVMSDFEESGHEDVVRKIRRDFEAAGDSTTEVEIRRTLDQSFRYVR